MRNKHVNLQTYIKLGSRLPVQNIKFLVGCRLPIQFPVADSKHKVSSRLPVAGCRFNGRLPIQLPIRNKQYKFNESATGN